MSNVGIYEVRYNKSRKPHLVRTAETTVKGNVKIDKPDVAWEVFESAFLASQQVEEYVYLMCCDSAGYIIGLFVVSHGNTKGALINMSGIIQRAVLCNAVNIMIAHNHPSGECGISIEDRKVFERLQAACNLMEIGLLDNMIIGNGQYLSFREQGMLD